MKSMMSTWSVVSLGGKKKNENIPVNSEKFVNLIETVFFHNTDLFVVLMN